MHQISNPTFLLCSHFRFLLLRTHFTFNYWHPNENCENEGRKERKDIRENKIEEINKKIALNLRFIKFLPKFQIG